MDMKVTLWRRGFVGIVAALFLVCALIGCAGSSKKEEKAAEEKGSMSRTFTLTDEQGRKAGTLKVEPFGGATLYDADGKVIKTFQAGGSSAPAPQPAATPSESDPAEAEPETKTDQ
jgi:cytochrome oxidase Cu insertion factor (SCO1/SenC/PrrC family)